MFPSYSGLKIVHDQMIQEELERHRANEAHTSSRQGLSQMLGKVLARFTTRPEQEQKPLLPCKTQEESCTLV